MISRTSEYALRAVVHLAQRDEGPAAAQQIAEATRVPLGYLQKILRLLARAGILSAQRGAGGGFQLARAPGAISVLDVLRASEAEIGRIERCPKDAGRCDQMCALHRMLDTQFARAEDTFARTSIGALLAAGAAPAQGGSGLAPFDGEGRSRRGGEIERSANGQRGSNNRKSQEPTP